MNSTHITHANGGMARILVVDDMATNRALSEKRRRDHIRELEGLIGSLGLKQASLAETDHARAGRRRTDDGHDADLEYGGRGRTHGCKRRRR